MSAPRSAYNNIMARLRVARDKYYAGYAVGGDVSQGTRMEAAQINNAATWCTNVTNKSPLRYTYSTVSSGEKIAVAKLNTNYNQINAVSTCYSNCHSNCHNNCDCAGHSCADGR